MTHFKKTLGGLAVVGMLAAAPVYAIPSLTFTSAFGTETVDPFTGIDWVATASAVTENFVPDGTTVATTHYLASASGIFTSGGLTADLNALTPNGIFAPPLLGEPRYEFTVRATIFETATCADTACDTVAFTATGGSFEIFFDATADSNRNTGAGFTNGTRIIAGTILPGFAGQFTGDGTGLNGSGNFEFFGAVTFTETDSTQDAWINPELVSTNAVATLQLGSNLTGGWTRPTAFIDAGFASLPATNQPNLIVFQADGNQAFAVPEPGTITLLGLGLLGLAGGAWRRRQS